MGQEGGLVGQMHTPLHMLKSGWRQKFSDRGAGASDRVAKMTENWRFHALFCQISSDENPKFPPTGSYNPGQNILEQRKNLQF